MQRLELSLLYFFQYFRKAYIGEQANVSSPNLYQRLTERVGVSDNLMVMNVIVNKTMSNLKVWSRHEEIVDKSLLLFHELASGYSSSKTLSKLDVVTYTLRNHGPQQLPFLNESGNPRHRTTFYTTLTRILLMDDQGHMDFDQFMAPFTPVLQHLQAFLSSPAHANPGPLAMRRGGCSWGCSEICGVFVWGLLTAGHTLPFSTGSTPTISLCLFLRRKFGGMTQLSRHPFSK